MAKRQAQACFVARERERCYTRSHELVWLIIIHQLINTLENHEQVVGEKNRAQQFNRPSHHPLRQYAHKQHNLNHNAIVK